MDSDRCVCMTFWLSYLILISNLSLDIFKYIGHNLE